MIVLIFTEVAGLSEVRGVDSAGKGEESIKWQILNLNLSHCLASDGNKLFFHV